MCGSHKVWGMAAAAVVMAVGLAGRAAADAADAAAVGKVCGVYVSVVQFASRGALDAAAGDARSFSEKHRRMMAGMDSAGNARVAKVCGFDTLFMTIYPMWGRAWWDEPAARGVIKDALVQTKGAFRVHLGLSLLNGNFVGDLKRYPGVCQAVQCDGTRPNSVCYYEDALWADYERNVIEMVKVGREAGNLDGIFLDPEGYAGEAYACFCDHCVAKFDAWAHADMPAGLVKPDGWLRGHGLWGKFAEWRAAEVRRRTEHLREVVRGAPGGAGLQLSSLLWDYPVAVGRVDARATYFRELCVGLGTAEQPSWTMPEHSYYSDAADLRRVIGQVREDLRGMGAEKAVRVVPGVRLLRRGADTLAGRGAVIRDADVAGYWVYELADLRGKTPIEFEGRLVDPSEAYVKALAEMNGVVRGAGATGRR